MQKIRVEYDSSLSALVAISKRLSWSEKQHDMASEEFYDRYSKGLLDDTVEFVEWANDYRHYLAVYKTLEKRLRHVA